MRVKKYILKSIPVDVIMETEIMTSSRESATLLRNIYEEENLDINCVESFIAIFVDVKNHMKGYAVISTGGVNTVLVDPRVIFKHAVSHLASGIILGHNHPSQRTNPSKPDKQLTTKVVDGAKLLGMKVLDHIILTDEDYFSFKDEDLI